MFQNITVFTVFFDQINAALVSIRKKKNIKKIELKLWNNSVCIH